VRLVAHTARRRSNGRARGSVLTVLLIVASFGLLLSQPATAAVPAPSITSISPTQGPEAGGTSVTVTGAHFSPVSGSTTAVKFGTTNATSVSNVTDTSLSAVAPAGTGTKNVTVTVTPPSASAQTSNGVPFTYVPAPTVTSVSPTSGPVTGGTDVTITGDHFQPGAQVLFGPSATGGSGDSPASPVQFVSATSLVATTRPGIVGATNVVVVNPDGQVGALTSGNANHYSFTGTAPSITSVSPTGGSSLGGTTVTLGGAGFLQGRASPSAAPAPAGSS